MTRQQRYIISFIRRTTVGFLFVCYLSLSSPLFFFLSSFSPPPLPPLLLFLLFLLLLYQLAFLLLLILLLLLHTYSVTSSFSSSSSSFSLLSSSRHPHLRSPVPLPLFQASFFFLSFFYKNPKLSTVRWWLWVKHISKSKYDLTTRKKCRRPRVCMYRIDLTTLADSRAPSPPLWTVIYEQRLETDASRFANQIYCKVLYSPWWVFFLLSSAQVTQISLLICSKFVIRALYEYH